LYSSLDPLHEHVKAALHYLQIVFQKRYIHIYCKEKTVNVNKEEDGTFFITNDHETSVKAKKVVGSCGRVS
jgi:L-2-hydroxyglutarate oxidase LhgO